MKHKKVDGEITSFAYNRTLKEWTASFTENELRAFVKRIRKRATEGK